MQHILNDEEYEKLVVQPLRAQDQIRMRVSTPDQHDEFGTPKAMLYMPSIVDINESPFMTQRIAPMSLLAMRMRWGAFKRSQDGDFTPPTFSFVAVHEVTAENKFIVFLVRNGKPVTLEDPLMDFPSDSLIAKLRLLEAS